MTYPGGKGSCYQQIINQMPPHRVYVETHLGGGAVMRHKRPARVNIGCDLDAVALREAAHVIAPAGHAICDGPAAPSQVARLASTVNHGDGIDGTAESGDGGSSTINRGGARAPSQAAVRAVRFAFLRLDAVEFLRRFDWQGDEFVYCDPPYPFSTRRNQRQLYLFEYEDADHERLLAALRGLPCRVALSSYWSELYADTLHDWRAVTFTAQTRGGPAEEWLWMNYPPPARLHDYRFLGSDYRERERIRRKKARWVRKLRAMDPLERQAILWAIQEAMGENE